MKNTTINRAAHDLVENSQVTARIGELLEEGRKRHDITVDSLTEQLQGCLWPDDADKSYSSSRSNLGVSYKLHGLDKPAQKKQEDLFAETVIRVVDNPEPMGKPGSNPLRSGGKVQEIWSGLVLVFRRG